MDLVVAGRQKSAMVLQSRRATGCIAAARLAAKLAGQLAAQLRICLDALRLRLWLLGCSDVQS